MFHWFKVFQGICVFVAKRAIWDVFLQTQSDLAKIVPFSTIQVVSTTNNWDLIVEQVFQPIQNQIDDK
jgi:hypothetical protein